VAVDAIDRVGIEIVPIMAMVSGERTYRLLWY
jgi:hypothetical protein